MSYYVFDSPNGDMGVFDKLVDLVKDPSDRANVSYYVFDSPNGDMSVFDKYVDLVKDPSVVCPKVIIYCNTIDLVTNFWEYFCPHVPYVNTVSCRVLCSMKKDYVLSEFQKPDTG